MRSAPQLQVKLQVGATGAVQRHLHQGFVQRGQEMPKTINPAAIPQSLPQGLPQADAHVFVGVVIVNLGVPMGLHLKIKEAMAHQLHEHVAPEKG